MAAVTRRQYKGAAAQTTITNALASGDTSATLAATTGWPSTASVPFYVVISPGTASEEKCRATISGSVLTLTRAQDDTTAQSHASGATIYPVFTADDADEANKFASTMTTRGDLVTMGSGPDFARIAIGSSGQVLKSDGTDAAWAVDPATDLVTTKGDLLVATAADTLTRLPVGIDGYRVTAASGETGGLKYDMPSVPVAADASARDALFGGAGEKVLAEGQLCYLQDLNVVQYYDGSSWATLGPSTSAVVQVKSTAKTDTFSVSSSTFTDVTGLAQSITPTSASNKVLILAQVSVGVANQDFGVKVIRDSTDIYIGDASGALVRSSVSLGNVSSGAMSVVSINFLDSPATTSATNYKIQIQSVSGGAVYVNRGQDDAEYRAASSITVLEVTP
jgi:hypothetical protein